MQKASATGFKGAKMCQVLGGSSHFPSMKLTAKAPENGWLADYFHCGKAYFQGRTGSFSDVSGW